ncbi:hypothetical protein EDB82DRAFT_305454 [Fusarium venenatum]|uniref:uncharacterized protein n=1 Tax=Fusarium venenatum TaxID=56646 RepID=UPI001D7DC8EC|nr:hypothetical protein EDB82DRAFT_305454 [Fusarium venenatum]
MHRDLQKWIVRWFVFFQMVLNFLRVLDLFAFVTQGDERQPAQLRIIVKRENDELSRRYELIVTPCVLFAINCLLISAFTRDLREFEDAATNP